MYSGEAYIFQSKFTDNNCDYVLLTMEYADTVYINESSFINNREGAIFIAAYNERRPRITLFITNCEFTANYAEILGGAIYSLNAICDVYLYL